MFNQLTYIYEWAKTHRESRNKSQRKYLSKHPSMVNWDSMMQRCYNKKHRGYKNYGAKGITVYKPWHSFKMYEKNFGYTKPGAGYVVDRIDPTKDYQPGNVQWLTRVQNTIKGSKLCLIQ